MAPDAPSTGPGSRRYLLHHGLERSAATSPDAPAVLSRDRTLSYGELDARANQLAAVLGRHDVAPGDRVALYLDKSVESVVAVYAALKAGAAYVPLDPSAPASRLALIASDCRVRCLISGREKARNWPALVAGSGVETIIVLNATGDEMQPRAGALVVGTEALPTAPRAAPTVPTVSQDLAYILYTSGSTGVPKGVMLSHANALCFVDWAVPTFGVGPGDRLSSHAPFHFDLSIFDLFAASVAGAAVVLVPPDVSVFPVEVARFITEHRISIWYSVPSVLSMLVLRGGLETHALPSLRTVLFAGEVFPAKYLRQLMALLPHVRFCNLYGPTETNVCTWLDVAPLPPDQTEPVPIGRAIDDTDAFAITEDGHRAQAGAEGELHVRGGTVMRGYWGDPARTDLVLVADPSGVAQGPVYRTGDLVRARADGGFEFLGRRDAQVKSRGYRIELGDIETALDAVPDVIECAAVAVPDEIVTNRIHAFVVVAPGVTATDLVAACSTRLPRYMVPERFELRASLPKTSTGKVDRRSLLAESTNAGDPGAATAATDSLPGTG